MKADGWLGNTPALDSWRNGDRAYDTARLIQDKPTSITVIRAGVAQDAQTVRIDPVEQRPSTSSSPAGRTARQRVLVTGYKSHPAISDTDLQHGDRFAVDSQMYDVVDVAAGLNDRLLAYAEVRG